VACVPGTSSVLSANVPPRKVADSYGIPASRARPTFPKHRVSSGPAARTGPTWGLACGSLYTGQFDDPTKPGATWTAVTDTVGFAADPEILINLTVYDDDGGLNFNDLVATGSGRYVAPNVPG